MFFATIFYMKKPLNKSLNLKLFLPIIFNVSLYSCFAKAQLFSNESQSYVNYGIRLRYNPKQTHTPTPQLQALQNLVELTKEQTHLQNSSKFELSQKVLLQVPFYAPNQNELSLNPSHFVLKNKLNTIQLKETFELSLDSYFEDADTQRRYLALNLKENAFSWGKIPDETLLSVSAQRELVNQLILLSYDKQLPGFQSIQDSNGITFKYTQVPQLKPLQQLERSRFPTQAVVRVKVYVMAPKEMLGLKERLAFEGPFELSFDAFAEVVAMKDASDTLKLKILGADLETLKYDKSRLTLVGKATQPIVNAFMRKIMDDTVDRWKAENKDLGIFLKLPSEYLGLKLKIIKFDTLTSDDLKIHLTVQ